MGKKVKVLYPDGQAMVTDLLTDEQIARQVQIGNTVELLTEEAWAEHMAEVAAPAKTEEPAAE